MKGANKPVPGSGALLRSAIICDLTLPFEGWTMGREEILERFYQAGVTFVSLTIYRLKDILAEMVEKPSAVRAAAGADLYDLMLLRD